MWYLWSSKVYVDQTVISHHGSLSRVPRFLECSTSTGRRCFGPRTVNLSYVTIRLLHLSEFTSSLPMDIYRFCFFFFFFQPISCALVFSTVGLYGVIELSVSEKFVIIQHQLEMLILKYHFDFFLWGGVSFFNLFW